MLSDLDLEDAPFQMPQTDSDLLILAGDILTPGQRAVDWAAMPSVKGELDDQRGLFRTVRH